MAKPKPRPGPNRAEIKRVIAAIEAAPPEQLQMRSIFGVLYRERGTGPVRIRQVYALHLEDYGIETSEFLKLSGEEIVGNACGTTACIAGFTACINAEEWDRYYRATPEAYVSTYAAEKLGLDHDTATRLFNEKARIANRDDALTRLRWLYKHGDLDGYDWSSESYCQSE